MVARIQKDMTLSGWVETGAVQGDSDRTYVEGANRRQEEIVTLCPHPSVTVTPKR